MKRKDWYMMYQKEDLLVQDFLSVIHSSPFAEEGPIKLSTEFDYRRGRTDIIVLNSEREVIAIEAKILNWKVALHQAYRNTSFAHYSYVLLPEEIAKKASRFEQEFSKRSVGLCYLSEGVVVVAMEASRQDPIQPWLCELAATTIQGNHKDANRQHNRISSERNL